MQKVAPIESASIAIATLDGFELIAAVSKCTLCFADGRAVHSPTSLSVPVFGPLCNEWLILTFPHIEDGFPSMDAKAFPLSMTVRSVPTFERSQLLGVVGIATAGTRTSGTCRRVAALAANVRVSGSLLLPNVAVFGVYPGCLDGWSTLLSHFLFLSYSSSYSFFLILLPHLAFFFVLG